MHLRQRTVVLDVASITVDVSAECQLLFVKMALSYNGIWEELARENARSMRARELRTGGEWCGLVGVACDLCRDRWMLLLRYHATPHCVSGSGFVRESEFLSPGWCIARPPLDKKKRWNGFRLQS